ncbi:MAG TPA: glutamine amidotransferase [Dehalococcoidia bacterium]|nr:glutamine amidotransferase [Dehalococcoidia bacterium]
MSDTTRILRLGHLYPSQMNIYGDRGNIVCLQRRCRLRGIELEVTGLKVGDVLRPDDFDLLFIGGAQDREQTLVCSDLAATKGALREAIDDGVVFLGVCGGYQLSGRFYRGADGVEMRGAGVFDLYTLHPGPHARRLIGNLAADWEGGSLAGFENHGGRTYLGSGCEPLARVLRGHGNDGASGFEGARYKNAFGSYLHGPILPKNPAFADRLLSLAMERRYGSGALSPLDDSLEQLAHASALKAR